MVNKQAVSEWFKNNDTASEQIDIYGAILQTPIGEMVCLSGHDGIILLEFIDQHDLIETFTKLKKQYPCRWCMESNTHINQLQGELSGYFAGTQFEFKVPCQFLGTDFQICVWETLKQIPYGQTLSYKTQAQMMKKERAIRAVANSNARNKIAIVIPCHRVIGSDGTLTGYAGGVWRKAFLLNHEKQSIKGCRGNN